MTDKILKEAFDKMVAIEEDDSGSDYYSEKRQKRKDKADNASNDNSGSDYYSEKRQKRKDNADELEEGAFDDQYGNTTDRGPNAPKNKPIERVAGSEHDHMMRNLEAHKKKKRVKEGGREDSMDGIEEFEEIQGRLFELIEELDSAIRAYSPGDHSYWQSYGLGQLKIIAGSDEYASNDRSITTLINDLKDEAQQGDGGRDPRNPDDWE